MIYRVARLAGLAGMVFAVAMAAHTVIAHPISVPMAAALAAVYRAWW